METKQERKAYFLGANRLGDFLCTTPVIHGFRQKNPDAFITYIVQDAPFTRILDGNPDIDRVVYSKELLVDEAIPDFLTAGIGADAELYRFDIQEVCSARPTVFNDHIAKGFSRVLGISVGSVRPIVRLSSEELGAAAQLVQKPYIILSMHTGSTVIATDGSLVLKDWIFENWLRLAGMIPLLGDFDIIAIGSDSDPQVSSRYFRNLYGLPIRVLAALLGGAACVISVESGISHLCHAVDAPLVLLYSRFISFPWAFPREASVCRVIYKDPCFISAEEVLSSLKLILSLRKIET
jgi:ADP-heptose:LPS heptosyltransferase